MKLFKSGRKKEEVGWEKIHANESHCTNEYNTIWQTIWLAQYSSWKKILNIPQKA